MMLLTGEKNLGHPESMIHNALNKLNTNVSRDLLCGHATVYSPHDVMVMICKATQNIII